MQRIWIAFIWLAMLPVIAVAKNVCEPSTALNRQQGLLTVHHRQSGGCTLLELPAADEDGLIGRYVYAMRLASGIGSNPIGLDRGYGDSGRVLIFRRVGDSVIAEIDNTEFRANGAPIAEERAVRESFARSIIWSAEIIAEASDGRMTVDFGSFLTRDAMYIGAYLSRSGHGSFSLADDRSFPTKALVFPDNVELEALLTFVSTAPGEEIQATTPEPEAVTVTMHHSIVRLPDDGYRVRAFDPRSAAIDLGWYDFAQPLTEPLMVRVVRRYRLEKTNPGSAPSTVNKPIVFYVDPGAPEPIRSALVEGAGWWAQAFEAAGFIDAYRVEVLPDDAHPMDARYNVIQWVHRQTRGWSYGGGVADPRTGEMLKGHVILGSQRVRQDRMIFESMVGAAANGSGAANDPTRVALARIRQLAAHEVGHSLGFYHNMAASVNERASVMDYPAPRIRLDANRRPDLSDAYGVGIGAWDKVTVAWLYSEFDDGTDETVQLNAILKAARDAGLHYVADQHSRSVANAHPYGSVWDNGANAIDELETALAVRAVSLESFGKPALAPNREIADLATVFAPLYLYHRYQVDAAAKFVGGAFFNYGLNGQNDSKVAWVEADEQRRALSALLRTLDSDTLTIPARITELLTPPLDASEPVQARERFGSRLGPLFDRGQAAGAAARITLKALLSVPRLNRVEAANSADAAVDLSVTEILDATSAVVFGAYEDSIVANAVRDEYVTQLASVYKHPDALPAVKAMVFAELTARQRRLRRGNAIGQLLARRITAELEAATEPVAAAEIPPGSPIGSDAMPHGCWHCDTASLLAK
ncbi:MAG: zinc-dependent metalloprotease [Pseudomonadota bacterium]